MSASFDSPAFRDALVILGAVGIVIPAFTRARVTPVIGFILVGLLLGPSGLGAMGEAVPWLRYVTIGNRDVIEPFAEFGIILLLFSIGLELSFGRLWDLRRLVFILGPAELLISATLIAATLVALGMLTAAAVALGLALALSSTALVLPMTSCTRPRISRGLNGLLKTAMMFVGASESGGRLNPRAVSSSAGIERVTSSCFSLRHISTPLSTGI